MVRDSEIAEENLLATKSGKIGSSIEKPRPAIRIDGAAGSTRELWPRCHKFSLTICKMPGAAEAGRASLPFLSCQPP